MSIIPFYTNSCSVFHGVKSGDMIFVQINFSSCDLEKPVGEHDR